MINSVKIIDAAMAAREDDVAWRGAFANIVGPQNA